MNGMTRAELLEIMPVMTDNPILDVGADHDDENDTWLCKRLYAVIGVFS